MTFIFLDCVRYFEISNDLNSIFHNFAIIIKMTLNTKKQSKITHFTSKNKSNKKGEDEFTELEEEIEQLEAKLRAKKDELFQIQRNKCRVKNPSPKEKEEPTSNSLVLVLSNLIELLKGDVELMSMLTGMEVQSYKQQDHCRIMYHMQHECKHHIKHGLNIDLATGLKQITKCSMPLGFKLSAIVDEFDSLMVPNCLSSIRKALFAYYDRLEQFEALKNLVGLEANLFKIIDGSHMEISLLAQNEREPEEGLVSIILELNYRVYDIRPKTFGFRELDLPEGATDLLIQQCQVFKEKPLHRAFRRAFVTGVGPFKLKRQFGAKIADLDAPRRRPRPTRPQYNNDDTFRPEECSDTDEDVD